MQIEPVCRFCLRDGKVTVAQVAAHIEPHCGDVNQFHLGRLQKCCRRHLFWDGQSRREKAKAKVERPLTLLGATM